MKKHAKFLFFCWTSFVLTLIAWPMREYDGTIETNYDKVAHIFMFGIFAFLFINWQQSEKPKFYNYFLGIGLGIAYALVGEFIQNFVPGRDVSERDLIAGVIGVILGAIFFSIISFFAQRKSSFRNS